ncbi:MAG: hypothetical protein JO105_15335 [Hyphomicrobiales bacterium]|nr:hypothetical protein [Hyphomicrobiales bacterium]
MMATATHITATPRFATCVRQAIETSYIGPRNHRGSRVMARCLAGSHSQAWDHSLGVEMNHREAARALITALGWTGEGWQGSWHQGGDVTGDGYRFVFAPEPNDFDRAPSGFEALHHERATAQCVRDTYLGALKFHFHGLLLTQGAPTSKLVRRRMWAIAKTKAERAADRARQGDPRPITCRVWNPSDLSEGWS